MSEAKDWIKVVREALRRKHVLRHSRTNASGFYFHGSRNDKEAAARITSEHAEKRKQLANPGRIPPTPWPGKKCPHCGRTPAEVHFKPNPKAFDGMEPSCRDCRRTMDRKSAAKRKP